MKIVSVLAAMLVQLLIGGPAAEEAPELPVETPVETVAEIIATPEPETLLLSELDLSGDWAGYWEIFSADGQWGEMDSFRWDCWAEMNEDDALYLWDEDLDKATGLARIELERKDNELVVSGGWLMDQNVGNDCCKAMISEDEEGLQLTLRGTYSSEDSGDFSFVFYLRPQK